MTKRILMVGLIIIFIYIQTTAFISLAENEVVISHLSDSPEWARGVLLINVPGSEILVEQSDDIIDQFICAMNFDQQKTTMTRIPTDGRLIKSNLDSIAVMSVPEKANIIDGVFARWRTFEFRLLRLDNTTNKLIGLKRDNSDIVYPNLELKEIPLDWISVEMISCGEDYYRPYVLYLGLNADSSGSLIYQLSHCGYVQDESRLSYNWVDQTVGDEIEIDPHRFVNQYAELTSYTADTSPDGTVAYTYEGDIVVMNGEEKICLSRDSDDQVTRFCWADDDTILYFCYSKPHGTKYILKRWDLRQHIVEEVYECTEFPEAMAYNQTTHVLAAYLRQSPDGRIRDRILIASIDSGKAFYYEPWTFPADFTNKGECVYYGQDEHGVSMYSPENLIDVRLVWINTGSI